MKALALAAILTGSIFAQDEATDEQIKTWVRQFLKGPPEPVLEATRHLKNHAERALPLLMAAKAEREVPRRAELIQLIHGVKQHEGIPVAKEVFWRLQTIKIDIRCERLGDLLERMREKSSCELTLSPNLARLEGSHLDAAPTERTILWVLESLCERFGVDYGFRFGSVWIDSPTALWGLPPPPRPPQPKLTAAQEQSVRDLIPKLGDDSLEIRDQARSELEKLGASVCPILKDAMEGADLETAGRCKALLEKLDPGPLPQLLPRQNLWADASEGETATRLKTTKGDFEFRAQPLEKVLDHLQEFAGLKIVYPGELALQECTLERTDCLIQHALEVLTLPRGLDVRIEGTRVVIFKR